MNQETLKYDLSIVATSRNDNHGGNLIYRMQLFINGLRAQCQYHNINVELILVEWNPPSDKPRLAEVLHLSKDANPCEVRIIEVLPELHNRFKFSDRLPLFQMIAKNVGIRRSKGKFVLATNIDILFSDELFCFFASDSLRKGHIYRINRYDVPSDVPIESTIEQQLAFCKDHIIRICCREGIYDRKTNKFHRIYIPFPFMGKRLHRPGWRKFVELGKIRMFRIPFRFSRLYREWLRLHTNACGDFTMMARDDWFDLRGYPELEMFSLHVDSLLCYIAYSAEIKEVVLDYPIFHIEHSEGWTPEVERDRSLYDRLDKAHIPRLTMKQLDDWVAKMCREREPIIFNDENWGLADENMSEVIL